MNVGIPKAKWFAASAIGAWLLVGATAWAADETEKTEIDLASKPASVWMKQKLSISQDIFAGLTAGELETVREQAELLQVLNRLEVFVRGRNEAYRTQLSLFQFAAKELIEAGKESNIDRATLAYTQMSVSCIQCHKLLRDRSAD